MSSEIVMKANMLKELKNFLKKNKKADLLSVYLHYLEESFGVTPVLFMGTKTIYKSENDALRILGEQDKIWRKTEIKVVYEKGAVNIRTKRVYICPYSGKVFGDNTHPSPQDAIYEWVSSCAENKDRSGGVRTKRFLVSDDPEVIKKYISNDTQSLYKTVYSSQTNGKLYSSIEALLEEFRSTYIRKMSLAEVQNQTKFHIHEDLMDFLQTHLQEDNLSQFVESLSATEELKEFVQQWIEEEE